MTKGKIPHIQWKIDQASLVKHWNGIFIYDYEHILSQKSILE